MENKALDELNFASESSFALEGVAFAKKIITRLKRDNLMLEGTFESDKWILHSENIYGRYIYLHFDELNELQKSKNIPNNFKNIIKCWVAYLLDNYYSKTAQLALSQLIDFVIKTSGFDIEKVNQYFEHEDYIKKKNSTKKTFLTTIYNFLDYSDFDNLTEVMTILQKNQTRLKIQKGVRLLPPPYWVFEFDRILKDFFIKLETSKFGEETENYKIMFTPVKLWWDITTVIPIRPTEFSLITRNCVSYEDENNKRLYYLKLPRKKLMKKNSKRIQIIDKVAISKEIYDEVESYIKFTEQYGESKTLISYRSLAAIKDEKYWHRNNKNNLSYFSNSILYYLISKFYKIVANEIYNINIEKKHQLTPVHTRHIAFVNLMLQGIPPIERARLGGHQTITAQFHYSYHIEQWVDTEVFQLMTKYQNWNIDNKIANIKNEESSLIIIPEEIKAKAYPTTPPQFKAVLKDVGYCTDEKQRCESNECILCKHWGASPEELLEKKDIIHKKIYDKRNEIKDLINVLENIEKQFLIDDLNSYDPMLHNKHLTTINQLKAKIQQVSILQSKTKTLGEFSIND
ncbi:MAG: hypothetical protein UHX00_04610 [Caryophanon sp.]|nr:hypothetical protein [Caryophanon sp.]